MLTLHFANRYETLAGLLAGQLGAGGGSVFVADPLILPGAAVRRQLTLGAEGRQHGERPPGRRACRRTAADSARAFRRLARAGAKGGTVGAETALREARRCRAVDRARPLLDAGTHPLSDIMQIET